MTSAPARSSAQRISDDLDRSGSPAVTYVTKPVRRSARKRSKTCVILGTDLCPFFMAQVMRHALHVLVAAPGQIHEYLPPLAQFLRESAGIRHGVGRLERREDPLESRQSLERVQRFAVGDPRVLRPA